MVGWDKPLVQGRFLKRYKRFFADIEVDGKVVTAHVANTGSLRSVLADGSECWLAHHSDPSRKLKYSLESLASPQKGWVGINTSLPNKMVKNLLNSIVNCELETSPLNLVQVAPNWLETDWTKPLIKRWQLFQQVQSEFKISEETRLDFVLKQNQTEKKHFIEVKNVTYAEEDIALFPDAVTTRGQKHLVELMKLIQQGHSAEIIFTVQREDCTGFASASKIDPVYANLLQESYQNGVIITILELVWTPEGAVFSSKKMKGFN